MFGPSRTCNSPDGRTQYYEGEAWQEKEPLPEVKVVGQPKEL